jgi:NTP pyrophosphatase (non-canonical NTP hydrolase)
MNFNKLSDAETERLALLSEECGEVIQAVGKILRHGYGSCHPVSGLPNRESLERELGDIMTSLRLMNTAGDINIDKVMDHAEAKELRIGRHLHHNEVSEE